MKMTNEERQALIDESRSEITRMKRILETGSVAIGWARAYEKEILRHEIVLSALTAEPVEGVNELFTRAAPPAPVVGGRTMPRHEFSQMVNELRDVPAVQSKREKIVSILHAFNINPAGGSVTNGN